MLGEGRGGEGGGGGEEDLQCMKSWRFHTLEELVTGG